MKKLAKIALVGSLSCFMSPPVLADLNNGLVAHYPFCGNANDASGNGNNGTVHGAILTEDRFGNPKSSYSFNGVDNFIDVIPSTSLSPSNEVTFTAWVKPIGQ